MPKSYIFDKDNRIIDNRYYSTTTNTNNITTNNTTNGSISSRDYYQQTSQSTVSPVPITSGTSSTVDDSGKSQSIVDTSLEGSSLVTKPTSSKYSGKNGASPNYYTDEYFQSIMHYNGIYKKTQLSSFTKTHRFGILDEYGAISTGREFLFFTKPDLNIMKRDDSTGTVSDELNDALANIPFWIDLYTYRKNTIALLQSSYNNASGVKSADPFNHLFQNKCSSNLELQSLQAEMIDTPQNIYGVGFKYRGSSESSDDGPEFSLEFKDNRWLDVYTTFKAYEEYETLKHHGVISPYMNYITNKIVHDQFAIYKFIVDEDMETIIYYGKMYGVSPKSLPRDVFGNPNFDNGLSYSIDFSAAFYEDMNPNIIADFNALSKSWYAAQTYKVEVYNHILDRVDRRATTAAAIIKDTTSPVAKRSSTGYVYKLKWKGSDAV